MSRMYDTNLACEKAGLILGDGDNLLPTAE